MSPYAPAKIDLGGLLLGAVIGVGSILIIPKLLYILSGTYGAYARSKYKFAAIKWRGVLKSLNVRGELDLARWQSSKVRESSESLEGNYSCFLDAGEDTGFSQTLTKIDDVLARHGIDTTSCMQRAVCSYTQRAANGDGDKESESDRVDEQGSSLDRMVNAITSNQVFRTAMQGTAIDEAVEAGRAGRSCTRSYPHCGFSMETMLSLLANVIAAANAARVPTPTASSL